MDLTQLLEEIILVLVSIEVVELAYHLFKMSAYEKRIDHHLVKMDAHIAKMDEHLRELEDRMTRLYRHLEQGSQEGSE